MSTERRPTDIFVVGLGIKSVLQVTREAEEAVKLCRKVFLVDSAFGVQEYVRALCPEVVSLLGLYEEGGSRRDTYRAMAAHVLDEALEGPPVAFATYGHPQMYVHPTHLIRKGAAALDLRVRVIPGVSTLDAIVTDLGFDPGPNGLQMYEATDLLTKARPLQPDVPCLLWQVSAVETGLYSARRGSRNRFVRLQRYLLQTYPAGHPVTMVLSSTYPLIEPLMETFPLGELAERLADGLQIGTLFIPAVTTREVHDIELLRELFDPNHLEAITLPSNAT